MSFEQVAIAPGPTGPKGNRGQAGYEGPSESCGMCSTVNRNLGEYKMKINRDNSLIVETPILGGAPS